MNGLRLLAACSIACVSACDRKLDERAFRREAEARYVEAHAGWAIYRREEHATIFVRGDQVDTLDVGALFRAYVERGASVAAFFDDWTAREVKASEARRRSLEDAASEVLPILKAGTWIRARDLGAIGPEHARDEIRTWRKEVTSDVFVVLGIPEEKLGYRFASVREVASSSSADTWLARSIANLEKRVDASRATEAREASGRLLVLDLPNDAGVSGLVLSPTFRRGMLEKFGQGELGVAVPLFNTLIVFDPSDFVTVKPIRARTHQLYDTQNHTAFRGLLRFDSTGLGVLEPAVPKASEHSR